MSSPIETVIGTMTGIGMWVASIEWRIRGKVSNDRFADQQVQLNRVESHLWDLLKAGNIKVSIEPPDVIKNNNG